MVEHKNHFLRLFRIPSAYKANRHPKYKQLMDTFLRKYADKWDWIALSANPSVTQDLRDRTKDLPWSDTPIPQDHYANLNTRFTKEELDDWNFVETMHNPHWNWEKFSAETLDEVPSSKIANWFFIVWSRNPSLFRYGTCNQ